MSKTRIRWATHTVNWLTGCSKVSPACRHCYAEAMTAQLASTPSAPARYHDGVVRDRRWTGRVTYDATALSRTFAGLRDAEAPRRVFVNSMSDTFHPNAPPASLTDLAVAIRELNEVRTDHVLMLLTKRPEGMLEWQRTHFPKGLPLWVWVGCTVEDQQRADERIPTLLEITATVRFLSIEPLLGPLRLDYAEQPDGSWWCYLEGLDGNQYSYGRGGRRGGLSWIIVGGESGPHARPMHPDWVRSLRDQCVGANVPFFFKQWGEWGLPRDVISASLPLAIVEPDGRTTYDPPAEAVAWCEAHWMVRFGKHAAGYLLDGRTWDGLP